MKNYFLDYLKERPIFLSLIRGREAELFQKYKPFKKPVLDYGCGDGFFAKVTFASELPLDIGLDIDKKVLGLARASKVYKKTSLVTNGKFDFKSNYFSTVVSNCVLEHVENLDNDLKEISRVLKPRGKFICSVMTNNWDGYLLGGLFLGKYYKTWMRKKQVHVQLPTYEEWKDYFKDAGFDEIKSIGYLDKHASRWLDTLHYISSYSLLTKLIFDKWVILPGIFDFVRIDKWLKNMAGKKVSAKKASAIFFVLQKSS